jgi:hypothetical protein
MRPVRPRGTTVKLLSAAVKPVAAAASSLSRALRGWYGASPLHLLALLAAFALTGYALRAVVVAHQWRGFAVWFIFAIIGHDLLLFPLYSLADLSVRRLLPRWAVRGTEPGSPARPRIPVINYFRVPAGFALLLLAVWFPLILGLSATKYHRASGLGTDAYLWRWLAVTGAMFTISAATYAIALRRAASRGRGAGPSRHEAHPTRRSSSPPR